MAAQRITREDLFPNGTTVTAYPESNWGTWQLPPSGAPVGSSAGTAATMAAGAGTITGLTDGGVYYAYAQVGGVHTYVRFKASKSSGTTTSAAANLDKDNGQAGLFGPTCRGWNIAAVVATATLHRYHRVVPSRDMWIVALGHFVTVAATNNDQVDFGLADATLTPFIRTGLTAGKCNATDGQTIAITPTLLRAGVTYYYLHKYGTIGGTAATIAFAGWGGARVPRAFGSTAGLVEAGDMTGLAADALPASALTIQSSSANACPAGLLIEG